MKAFDEICKRINPVKYWKRKGAVVGSGTTISRTAKLSSEPFLVVIGKKCKITKLKSVDMWQSMKKGKQTAEKPLPDSV